MRIVLHAFGGKLTSGLMDIPESSGHRWEMILFRPISVYPGSGNTLIASTPDAPTRCTFEWTGKFDDKLDARIFDLIDVSKT